MKNYSANSIFMLFRRSRRDIILHGHIYQPDTLKRHETNAQCVIRRCCGNKKSGNLWGIEPLTSALRTRRSAKLSYCPTEGDPQITQITQNSQKQGGTLSAATRDRRQQRRDRATSLHLLP